MAQAYLAGALTEADVEPGFVEVAQALADLQAQNDQKRVREARRHHELMDPVAPSLRRSRLWLQVDDWRQLLPFGVSPELDILDANMWVVRDAAKPSQEVVWTCMLLGGCIVDQTFLASAGEQGVAFTYDAATAVRRHLFVSEEFTHAHRRLATLVVAAAGKPSSKWRLLDSWEAFAATYERLAGPRLPPSSRKPKQVLALATEAVKDALGLDSVMDRQDFEEFVRRGVVTKRGLCGR